MPALFIALSGSAVAKKAAFITGYYDHMLHSLFPPHFNLFTFLSIFSFMNGMALLSNKRVEFVATLFCMSFAASYPALHRVTTRILTPVALDPAPLVWISVVFVSLVFLRSRFFVKGSLLAMLFAALVLQPIGIAHASVMASFPVTLTSETRIDDRIDSSILGMTQPPEKIPVILRFPYLVSEEVLSRLNVIPFFEVSKHNGAPAVYNSHVCFVYGVIKTQFCDWREASRFLVKEFNLKYLILDRGIDPSQLLKVHPITYSVDADVLHALNVTGRGVTVAIIDSGINDLDPEIAGKTEGRIIYQVNLITGKEGDPLVTGDLTPADSKLHGTFVARTIAGVRGIAPHANIIDLKVQVETGEMCYVDSLRIVEAIEWCIRNKERFNISVINLSMGNREGGRGIVCRAVERASLAGIIVVTAAGSYSNPFESFTNPVFTPGVSSQAVTVGATQSYVHDFWACFPASAVGDWAKLKPDLVAPGPYTSGSTPIVAGIAALLFQAAEELGIPKSVRSIAVKHALLNGAARNDLGMPGFDPLYGYGKVNALASYLALKNFS
ncbi:MAG: S8 family serine peptidase [Candidatus Jordarchaeales archaeon]